MGKINGKNLWGKFMGKFFQFFNIANLLKNFPLAAIKKMGIKDMGIFNGTFSHNGNGKKYVN